MMTSPHFNSIQNCCYNIDPIYQSCFEVRFNNKFLLDNCISIENNIINFNLYIYENELQPFNIINDMINNNEIINYLEIINYNKEGAIKYAVFLEKFKFVEFVGFLDFDLVKYDKKYNIKNLHVKFKYDKMTVIIEKKYNNFIRKIKIKCLNEKDS